MFSIIVVFNVNHTFPWYFLCVCLHLLQSIQPKDSTCSDGEISYCRLTSTKKYSFVQFTAISASVIHGILNFTTSMYYLNDDVQCCFHNCNCKDISLFIAIIQEVSKFILVFICDTYQNSVDISNKRELRNNSTNIRKNVILLLIMIWEA